MKVTVADFIKYINKIKHGSKFLAIIENKKVVTVIPKNLKNNETVETRIINKEDLVKIIKILRRKHVEIITLP